MQPKLSAFKPKEYNEEAESSELHVRRQDACQNYIILNPKNNDKSLCSKNTVLNVFSIG